MVTDVCGVRMEFTRRHGEVTLKTLGEETDFNEDEFDKAASAAYDFSLLSGEPVTFLARGRSFTIPRDIMSKYETIISMLSEGIPSGAEHEDLNIIPSAMTLWERHVLNGWKSEVGDVIFNYLIKLMKTVSMNMKNGDDFTTALDTSGRMLGINVHDMTAKIAHGYLYDTWVHGQELRVLDEGTPISKLVSRKTVDLKEEDILKLAKQGYFQCAVVDGQWYVHTKQFRKWYKHQCEQKNRTSDQIASE
jgi:hypothetical protein